MASHKLQRCRKWFLLVSYGVFRGKGTIEVEDREWTFEKLKTFFNILFFWAAYIDFNGLNFSDFLVSV